VTGLRDPRVTRQALDALAVRLDGRRAAANTIARKRAVFHNALGYAVELGLLEVNPLGQHRRRTPRAASTADPRVIASPGQVDAILTQVTRIRPELTAFFGCLYYAALRPEEAVALRRDSLTLPASGWGQLTLSAALPRSARAWTGNGTAHEPRGLKLRPEGTTRTVPIPPQLVSLLRRHLRAHGTAPDGRLFRGARGGPLSESLYGRIWHQLSAPQHPAQPSTPSTGYCALTICGTPRCHCGWPPALPRPRSPPAPGTA
jgi:integrase